MNIVEEAISEIESELVAYMEFGLDYRKDSNIIYCFYEGLEDRSFYSHRVKSSFKDHKYLDYITNGKGNLIKLNKLIENHEEYNSSTIAYFVDRDFEPIINNQNIFTTSGYSIENLFFESPTFKNILLNEFGISHRDADFEKCFGIFNTLKHEFLEKSITLNAWLSCQTDIRLASGESTRLKIDDTIKSLLDSPIKSDLSSVIYPDSLSSKLGIESLFLTATPIPDDVLNFKIKTFETLNLEENVRGKFLIKFLACFLNRLKEEVGKKKSEIFEKRHVCRLRFEEVTCISQLTNNVETPTELNEYFEYLKGKAVA